MHLHRILGSPSVPAALLCPLCGLPVAPEILSISKRIEPPVLHRLHSWHPGWNANAGACPECVHRASEAVQQARSQTTIHQELMLPYPVYAPDEIRLLPTPMRLGTNPQYTGNGVTMAFVDAGFYPHPDLTQPENRILCYVDATDDEPVEQAEISQLQVSSWHGLMTSCVAAGNGYMSGNLYRGVASRANLVLVKAGNPRNRGILEIDIGRALSWVIANQERFNIRVVNISLGGDYQPKEWRLTDLDKLVEEAFACGIVVVAAAGNSGIKRLLPPATAPSAITVGGLDDGNSPDHHRWRMYHSNYGLTYQKQPKPEVIAPAMWLAAPMLPGSGIHREGMRLWRKEQAFRHTDRLMVLENPSMNGYQHRMGALRRRIRQRMIEQKYIHPHYQHVDGTSMAAPVVSSIIAQMLEANPSLTPAQVREILMNTAMPLEDLPAEMRGAGVIDAVRAVAAARRAAGSALNGLPISPDIQPDRITFYYFDPSQRSADITVIGSFNRWNPRGYRMHPASPGLWQLSIPALPAGSYRYKFLVGGSWMEDPENPWRTEDGYGGFSSLLDV